MLKKYGLFTFIMLSISVATVFMFNNVLTPEKKLPIYQPNMVKFQLVDSTVQHVKRFHKIKDFKLFNQNDSKVKPIVQSIIRDVQHNGDKALLKYVKKSLSISELTNQIQELDP